MREDFITNDSVRLLVINGRVISNEINLHQ